VLRSVGDISTVSVSVLHSGDDINCLCVLRSGDEISTVSVCCALVTIYQLSPSLCCALVTRYQVSVCCALVTIYQLSPSLCCTLVTIYQLSLSVCCLHCHSYNQHITSLISRVSIDLPEDAGSVSLRNVVFHLPDHTV